MFAYFVTKYFCLKLHTKIYFSKDYYSDFLQRLKDKLNESQLSFGHCQFWLPVLFYFLIAQSTQMRQMFFHEAEALHFNI